MVRTAMALFAGALLVVTSSAAAAQFRGGTSMPREGACFYEDANYRGDYFCAEAGEELSTMPSGANDKVSSIRIVGRAEITVFRDSRFRGDSLRFDANVRDLQSEDFNDAISSIQVEARSFGRDSRGRGDRSRGGSRQNPELIVRRAYQDILERDPDPVGMRTYRSHIIDDGWTEQDVREALRKAPSTARRTR